MNDNHKTELYLKYSMDDLERKAMEVAYTWIDLLPKVFPDDNHPAYPLTKNKDPRKSLLFKICYKLVRETKGIISDDNYQLYVRAQLEVLKVININKNEKPLICPQILTGNKAWRRWMLWKSKYDKCHAEIVKPTLLKITEYDLRVALEKSKKSISNILGEKYNLTQYIQARDNISQAAAVGLISPYYLALSPYAKELSRDGKRFHLDYDVIIETLPNKHKDIYTELFPEEVIIG